MQFHEKLLGCLVLWGAVVATSAEPSVCYYCTTDADGSSCNEPLDESGVRVQYCENSTVTTNVGAAKEIAGNSTTEGTYVCTTVTYTSQLQTFVTIRECQSRLIEGVDICTYLTKAAATSLSTNFSCKTCHSDLCSSNGTEDNNDPDNNNDPGDNNDPDNDKAAVHFSTGVFVVIALAKLFV